eukprot:TRINITY_DN13438_c0_g5_i1.p2 TRINITY_DN13438_c0_g5~~TRINITY_DN13438_c0_g5_i1.p2  ORF type:complete len:193 (-),score=36.08 TRINITY_DN13438_c0_g5_i1:979-1557(-)
MNKIFNMDKNKRMRAKCGLRNITVTVKRQVAPLTVRADCKINCAKLLKTPKSSSKRKLTAKNAKSSSTKTDTEIQEILKVPCMNIESRHKSYFTRESIAGTCIVNGTLRLRSENKFVPKVCVEIIAKTFKKGWLSKRGGKLFNAWKPRFCILKNSIFTYYRQENDSNIRGTINFNCIPCKLEVVNSTITYSF